ncbi:hypothetical protein BC834DRAFT_861952 [Gloeopeniophorella convolvens]|nr:hypothetical protein BC834DRAFT_861952 [Gloeopeniophorella convolvens]
MFNSKLLIAFLATLGAVGGVSASAVTEKRQDNVCSALGGILGSTVEPECCVSTIDPVPGLVPPLPLTQVSHSAAPTADGPYCCFLHLLVPPELTGNDVCLQLPA